MKGLILKFDGVLIARELEDIQEDFKNQLQQNGFLVIDDRYKVFEIDIPEENKN